MHRHPEHRVDYMEWAPGLIYSTFLFTFLKYGIFGQLFLTLPANYELLFLISFQDENNQSELYTYYLPNYIGKSL